jgi:hypothetical protein
MRVDPRSTSFSGLTRTGGGTTPGLSNIFWSDSAAA